MGRHWWYLPDFVRPWEENEVAQQLAQHERFLFVDKSSPNLPPGVIRPGVVALWLPLPARVREQLIPHLGPPEPVPIVGFIASRVDTTAKKQ